MLSGVTRSLVRLPQTGVEIALLDWGGDGPIALLHHANGFCGAVWAPIAEALRDHYRVVAMDARGHGDSSKPEGVEFYAWELFGRDVAGVARALAGGGSVALGLGHSFGGTSLVLAAADHPRLFERLLLVDPVVIPPAELLAEGARRRRAVWSSRDEARRSWQGKELFARWDERALDLYLAEGLRDRADGQVELKCPPEIEAAIFDATRDLDLWSRAEDLAPPVLIQWARRGNFPRAAYEQLAARMRDARVVDVDASHLVAMERPDLVVDAVRRFAGT